MAERHEFKSGAEAQVAGNVLQFNEPVVPADSLRFYLGKKLVGQTGRLALTTASSGGNQTITLNTWQRNHKCIGAVTAGGAPFTYIYVLPIEFLTEDETISLAPKSGDTVVFVLTVSASAHERLVEFRTTSDVGALIASIPGDSVARKWRVEFTWDGAAWEHTDSHPFTT